MSFEVVVVVSAVGIDAGADGQVDERPAVAAPNVLAVHFGKLGRDRLRRRSHQRVNFPVEFLCRRCRSQLTPTSGTGGACSDLTTKWATTTWPISFMHTTMSMLSTDL